MSNQPMEFEVSARQLSERVLNEMRIQGHSISEWIDLICEVITEYDGVVSRREVRRRLNRLYDELTADQQPAILRAIETLETTPDIFRAAETPETKEDVD